MALIVSPLDNVYNTEKLSYKKQQLKMLFKKNAFEREEEEHLFFKVDDLKNTELGRDMVKATYTVDELSDFLVTDNSTIIEQATSLTIEDVDALIELVKHKDQWDTIFNTLSEDVDNDAPASEKLEKIRTAVITAKFTPVQTYVLLHGLSKKIKNPNQELKKNLEEIIKSYESEMSATLKTEAQLARDEVFKKYYDESQIKALVDLAHKNVDVNSFHEMLNYYIKSLDITFNLQDIQGRIVPAFFKIISLQIKDLGDNKEARNKIIRLFKQEQHLTIINSLYAVIIKMHENFLKKGIEMVSDIKVLVSGFINFINQHILNMNTFNNMLVQFGVKDYKVVIIQHQFVIYLRSMIFNLPEIIFKSNNPLNSKIKLGEFLDAYQKSLTKQEVDEKKSLVKTFPGLKGKS